MMKTRRKSKAAAAAAAAADADTERGTQPEEGHILLTLPDEVDFEALSNLFPDFSLSTPSADEVVSIYRHVLEQAKENDRTQRELDEARAEMEKKDVELDQALQDRERATKELEVSLENEQERVKKLEEEKEHLLVSQTTLQSRVEILSSSQTSFSSETEALKTRVEETEREKRELVTVISRLREDMTHREDEIQTLRTNLKEARHDHQALESTVRELRSTETATKFKVESLSQQLQLAQAEAERTSSELATKSDEFTRYRHAKHSELATLQASYDSVSQSSTASQASLKALQSSQVAQSHQLSEALTRVQDLKGQLAEQEATYSGEINGLRRLVEMMEEREKRAKDVVESIEREWADVGERAERRENELKKEVERERKARLEVEKRAEQLEIVAERIGRGELPIPGRTGPANPGTPLRTPGLGQLDATTEGIFTLSPAVAIASKAQKTGKTFTQVYADYVQLQEDYAKKCAEYDHMDRTLNSVLLQIEERAPILSQQRAEYERLQLESSQLANQLAQTLSDRDSQSLLAQENKQKLTKATQEIDLLQKQLNDLGRQIQALLRELTRRDDPTIPPDEDLINVEPATDTESVITNNLVLFKSIDGLQQQNQKLLKVVRELGKKMEDGEREYREVLENEQGEAVREAHEAMQELSAQLEQQKKHHETIIQAYMKERDTLRLMLERAEKAGFASSAVQAADSEAEGNLAKELVEVQNQFDAYRNEIGVDSEHLREEVLSLQRETTKLNTHLAKANAQIEYLNDRHRLNESQYNQRLREVDELTKRTAELRDQLTRSEIACSHATDELSIANGRLEQMRNDSANLRAEKKIWEGVQLRLMEENKSLAAERSQLADLMVNLKKMQADLEHSGDNDRRRLEKRLEMIESQAQDLRTQLSQERDSGRHAALQKDLDLKDLQMRVEKAALDMSKTREALASAETSKKHLEERVEELHRQLKGNEEKLAVYERRPLAGSGSVPSTQPDTGKEEQLESEVAELRAALKVAEVDLATTRQHIEQYKQISQTSETALADLNTTMVEAEARSSAQLARYESDIKSLEEKLASAKSELADAVSKYSELQQTSENQRAAWLADKKQLEDTIVDITTSERHEEDDRLAREVERKQLEERVKVAEDRYAREVIVHADDIKNIEILKQQLATLQSISRENLTASETAKSKLASSESSWQQQKQVLDKELTELKDRCKELKEQNTTLYQHLESVSLQATRIRQAANETSAGALAEDDTNSDNEGKLGELRSVVTYLRREKEIVDLQHELGKQEIARLKSQVEHLSQSLNEARTTLSEEREKAMQSATSAAEHAELVDRINQLNILRESNATLRAESESRGKKVRELEAQLQVLSSQLEPVREEARMAKAESSAQVAQVKRLEVENRKWQERNAQILSKYDRIDPAEVQGLKDEIAKLKEEKEVMTKQLEAANANETSQDEIKKLKAEVDVRIRQIATFRATLGEANEKKSILTQEKKQLEAKIFVLESELQGAKASNIATAAEATKAPTDQSALVEALKQERDQLLAEKATWTQRPDGLTTSTDNTQAKEQIKLANEKISSLQSQLTSVSSENESYKQKILQMQKSQLSTSSSGSPSGSAAAITADESEKLQELRRANLSLGSKHTKEVKVLREELETLKAAAQKQEEKEQQMAEETKKAVEEARKQAQAEAKAGFQRAMTSVKKQAAEQLEKAVEAAKIAAMQQPAVNGSPPSQAEIDAAVKTQVEELKATHEKEISEAVDRGRLEISRKLQMKERSLKEQTDKIKRLEYDLALLKGEIPADTPPPAPSPAPRAAVNVRPAPAQPSVNSTATPVATATTSTVPAPATASPRAVTPSVAAPNAPKPAAPTAAAPVKRTASSTATPAAQAPVAQTPAAAPNAAATNAATNNLPKRPVAARGGAPIRGAARVPPRGGGPAGAGRGAVVPRPSGAAGAAVAAVAAAAAANQTTPAATGVSIMGAANKRTRDSDVASAEADDSSLAKRLKTGPATTTAAAAAAQPAAAVAGPAAQVPATTKPVQIRRPPPQAPATTTTPQP